MTTEEKVLRESFVFYKSFRIAIENLPPENQLNAFKFIISYWLFGIEPEVSTDPVAYAIYIMAKAQIDANNKRYANWVLPPWIKNAQIFFLFASLGYMLV